MFKTAISSLLAFTMILAAMPTSTNYELHNYGFGSGGTSGSNSSSYSLNATTGEASNVQSNSSNYQLKSGNNNTQQSNVPPAPTFNNPSNFYDKLHFVISTGNNPSDTLFSIAISTDNFTTTNYVQADNTVGSTLSMADFQTYAAWGGSSGGEITGLSPSTTYEIKVNAMQGNYTETQYGPSASAATTAPSITFSLSTDSQPSPPFSTSFGSLLPATVTSTTNKIDVGLSTNADNGAYVYISSNRSGLYSPNDNYTISSASADLSGVPSGYGAQGGSTSQSSGGPFSVDAPYNVSSTNVGVLDNSVRAIFSSSTPLSSGSGSITLIAKAASSTPASSDYQDTLTLTAAGAF